MKGFVSGTGQFEDPTYLGFRLDFDFDPQTRNPETNFTDSALFASPENTSLDSARRYLETIGYQNKAGMLGDFRTMLMTLTKRTPWYLQGIEGHKDLWSIPKGADFNNFRGKDKKLRIKCLESIDMRMTILTDLYRQATFDERNMRWLLPENLRWFRCSLVIAEIRNFHKLKNIIQASATNSVVASSSQSGEGGNEQVLEQVDPFISTIKFDLGRCEFDFEDSFFETVANDDGVEQAGFSFSIKVGTIIQDNTYPVYGYRINSFPQTASIDQNRQEARLRAFGFTRLTSQYSMPNQELNGDRNVFGYPPYPTGQDGKPLSGPPVYGTSDTPPPDTTVGGNVFEGQPTTVNPIIQGAQNRVNDVLLAASNAPANAIAGAVNNLQSIATAVVLGNVYDNNPAQAINSLVGQSSQLGNALIP